MIWIPILLIPVYGLFCFLAGMRAVTVLNRSRYGGYIRFSRPGFEGRQTLRIRELQVTERTEP